MFRSLQVSHRRRSSAVASPRAESLESRQLLAAIQVATTPGPNGSVNLDITGSDADDRIKISKHADLQVHLTDEFDSGTTFSLNGGTPVSELSFAAINNIRLRLGAGNDTARLIDLNAGNVTIEDGFADRELNSYDLGNQFNDSRLGDITANFPKGFNHLIIRSSLIFQDPGAGVGYLNSMHMGKVTVNSQGRTAFGAFAQGRAEIVINGLVTLNGLGAGFSTDSENASVRLIGGVKLQGKSSNASLGLGLTGNIQVFGNLEVETGAGDDNVHIGGNVAVSGQVKVNTAAGTDGFTVASGTSVFSQNVNLDLGDGPGYVNINPANTWFRKNLSISTGKQNDSVVLKNVVVAGDLSVNLGGSQPGGPRNGDYLELADFEIQKNFSLVSSGRTTAHILSNEYWTGIDTPAIFRGTVSMSMGAGNIRFRDVTMQKAQTFRGTNERIQVEYQNVIADLSRRRLINATATDLP